VARDRAHWPRNTDGLRQRAQERAAATKHRAEEAIALLVRDQRPITFRAVAQTAGVSSAWLYQHEEIKARIAHLRAQQGPRAKVWVPPQERASESSKDNVIRMLTERLKRLETESRELRKQLEVVYGLVHAREQPPS
jgi:hypothetical protein